MAERRSDRVHLLEEGKLWQVEIVRHLGVDLVAIYVWARNLKKNTAKKV